jgi:hypothetical protein
MKNYLIVETWNGEGYSSENIITEVKKFESDAFAKDYCLELVRKSLDMSLVNEGDIESRNNGYTYTINEEDSGSYQYFELTDECYGVMIFCNINEVSILNEFEFSKCLSESFSDATDLEEIDGDMYSKRVFFGAENINNDYDLQFERIEPSTQDIIDNLVYFAEGDGIEYEIWIDANTDVKYHVPISIERDFNAMEKISD